MRDSAFSTGRCRGFAGGVQEAGDRGVLVILPRPSCGYYLHKGDGKEFKLRQKSELVVGRRRENFATGGWWGKFCTN